MKADGARPRKAKGHDQWRNGGSPAQRADAGGGGTRRRRHPWRASISTFHSRWSSTGRPAVGLGARRGAGWPLVWPARTVRPSRSGAGFRRALCLPHLTGVEPLLHQIETVRKVLKQFRGRVLLADEVGLGKTIEAGMVLKEYALRGMAERSLVLTPASLVGQWREELETKFGLTFATTYDALLRDEPEAF